MKASKPFIVIIILSGIFLASCKKDVNPEVSDPNKNQMTQLMIDPNFDWSIYKEIDVKLSGIPGAIDIKKTLTLHDEGAIYYQNLFSVNQNLSMKIIVPTSLNSLTLEYGSFVQTFNLTDGKIVYSFLPVIEE